MPVGAAPAALPALCSNGILGALARDEPSKVANRRPAFEVDRHLVQLGTARRQAWGRSRLRGGNYAAAQSRRAAWDKRGNRGNISRDTAVDQQKSRKRGSGLSSL